MCPSNSKKQTTVKGKLIGSLKLTWSLYNPSLTFIFSKKVRIPLFLNASKYF